MYNTNDYLCLTREFHWSPDHNINGNVTFEQDTMLWYTLYYGQFDSYRNHSYIYGELIEKPALTHILSLFKMCSTWHINTSHASWTRCRFSMHNANGIDWLLSAVEIILWIVCSIWLRSFAEGLEFTMSVSWIWVNYPINHTVRLE